MHDKGSEEIVWFPTASSDMNKTLHLNPLPDLYSYGWSVNIVNSHGKPKNQ